MGKSLPDLKSKANREFLGKTVCDLLSTGVEVDFKSKETVYSPVEKERFSGFFIDKPRPRLSIAMKDPNWFEVFVHESCHFDQWREKIPLWESGYVDGVDCAEIFFRWMSDGRKVKKKLGLKCGRLTRDLELDCERRVLEKIKKYRLDIDVPGKIKRGAAYIHCYNFMMKHRKYLSGDIWESPGLFDVLPDDLDGDFNKLPKKVENAFLRLR